MPRRQSPVFDPKDDLLDARPVATLDLHGRTVAEVEGPIRNFLLTEQRRRKGAVVHIITGKGRNSPGGPVLRDVVGRLLKGKLASLIAESARDVDEGGFLVRVR